MALTSGTRLGIYDIVAPLGAGGMGEVYRARDTKLNRDVALKILPAAFAGDPDRLARFTREAQTLASLNHSNIAHIHGLEEAGGVRALVMELVDGDDLSQKLEGLRAKGSGLPLDDVLPIAKQIAEALEAAHEQGIIHRDLKPANIKVRPDGTVKVLDFGLAKAMDPIGSMPPGVSLSPTLTSPAMMTGIGMILGTAAYMAPEQAKGRAVDKRADIWAFGVVVHEMLTGKRLFDAEDMSETLAAVLTRDVSLTTLPAAVPARLRSLLRDCLVRDPRQRLRDIGDARIVLEQILAGTADVANSQSLIPNPQSQVAVPAWRQSLPWAVAVTALAAAVVTLWAPWRAEKPIDRPLVRLDVELGAEVVLPVPNPGGSNPWSTFAISPDGTRLTYLSGTPTRLFIRRLDQSKAVELPGTEGAIAPAFSPDGQWVGFVSRGKLNKISVDGGSVVPIGGTATIAIAWAENGDVLASVFQKVERFPAGGGPPETLAEPRGSELSALDPDVLPGGRAMLVAVDYAGSVDKTTIDVVTLPDRKRKTVIVGGASPRYVATGKGIGHLLYVNQATLFAIAFDLDALETRGTAVPILDDVAHESLVGRGQFDVSRTGTLVYRRSLGGASTPANLQWVDLAGARERLRANAGNYQDVSVSPDGTRLAVTVTGAAGQDVWVYDTQRDAMTRLTFGGTVYRHPVWRPDGREIAFGSIGKGIVLARADGSGQRPLTESSALQYPTSFSPDGTRLAYYQSRGNGQIWTVPVVEGGGGQLTIGKPEPFLETGFNDMMPSFSPDGRWLAYQSNESGTDEVYVRAFPPPTSGQGGKWQISNNGGAAPRWSRTGRELLYRSGDQLMAASYTLNGDSVVAAKPRVWISKLGGLLWDQTPDGKRVVVVSRPEWTEAGKTEHTIVFLLNFFDELRRRVPLGK